MHVFVTGATGFVGYHTVLALAAAGLATRGVGFAHALHTPYWMLRSVVGLPRADEYRLVRAYRLFLIRAVASRWIDRLERLLNYVCPKSLILYAEKPPSPGGASCRPRR